MEKTIAKRGASASTHQSIFRCKKHRKQKLGRKIKQTRSRSIADKNPFRDLSACVVPPVAGRYFPFWANHFVLSKLDPKHVREAALLGQPLQIPSRHPGIIPRCRP